MAVVLAATHEVLRQRVAIKVIHPQYAGSPELKERFFREARALAAMRSPHVARIFDVGTLDGGAAYLVLEYLEGLDLHRLLERDGPLSPGAAAAYVLQASDALVEAHQLGIVHRDLKPSNLFLVAGPNGEPCIKLLDFGLAKLTEEGVSGLTAREDVMGSPSYMAPEQIRGLAQAEVRSDVWSLGVTLYELLTNAFPFEGTTPTRIAAAVLTEKPIPLQARRPNLPIELVRAVMDCLVKEPDQRMASARHLGERLRPFASFEVPAALAKTATIAAVSELPRRPASHPAGTAREATVRISSNEPTYGGMLPLAPPSSPPSEPASSHPSSGGSSISISSPPAEHAPTAPTEDVAKDDRPDDATLVHIERPLQSGTKLDETAPRSGEQTVRKIDALDEELARIEARRARKTWVMVAVAAVFCVAVVALILFRGR